MGGWGGMEDETETSKKGRKKKNQKIKTYGNRVGV
jgi:hypothetical protein